jgi:hypothetical protein
MIQKHVHQQTDGNYLREAYCKKMGKQNVRSDNHLSLCYSCSQAKIISKFTTTSVTLSRTISLKHARYVKTRPIVYF